MLKTLTLANLSEIDNGRVQLAFDAAIIRVIRDLADRPNVDQARKIELIVKINPDCDVDQGVLVGGNIQFEVKDSVPKRQTTTYPMKLGGNGLLFEPQSPDNPNQQVLSDTVDDQD